MTAILQFHQCWSDIFMFLGLADYYATKYDRVILIGRSDAKDIYEPYFDGKQNIQIHYTDNFHVFDSNDIPNLDMSQCVLVPHGKFDRYRIDQYANTYRTWGQPFPKHYSELFYSKYGIESNGRIRYFNFQRNEELEEQVYKDIIGDDDREYVLYHDAHPGESNMEFDRHSDYRYIDLNGIVKNPFSLIKVLINAKEIHVVDSFWASVCFNIDAKYGLFNDVPIYLYPFKHHNRWGGILKDSTYIDEMNLPVKLTNWEVVCQTKI